LSPCFSHLVELQNVQTSRSWRLRAPWAQSLQFS
jgi:hypothetical protein